MGFGKNINRLRKKQGYSQEELGEKIGVTRQTISKWELEQTSPSLNDLNKIAEFFSVKIDDLISEESEEKNSNIITIKNNNTKKNKIFSKFLFFFCIFYC